MRCRYCHDMHLTFIDVSCSFEKGQRDEFIQESVDVGTIQKLQIGEPLAWCLSEPGLSHGGPRRANLHYTCDSAL